MPASPPQIPADPLEWRPQRALEVRLLDTFGVDIAPEKTDLAAALRSSLVADDAILDVILTDQATRGGQGTAVVTESRTSMLGLLTSRDVGVEIQQRGEVEKSEEAIVALDLLRLDGESLLDVPLLERKRLLESILVQSETVRVSVHARPPVDAWVATWKSAGLRGAILKAANSRYVPGSFNDQWREVTRVAGRR
jgi:hypothetical protein